MPGVAPKSKKNKIAQPQATGVQIESTSDM